MMMGVMINTECRICHGQNLSPKFGNLLECRECGIVFEDLDYSTFDPAKIYTNEYFQGKVYDDYLREGPDRIRIFREKYALIRNFIADGDTVLDVGCATGCFLKVLEEKRVSGYGVEISDFAAAYAREQNRLKVTSGDLIGARFPACYFDALTMWDVLEHLPNPTEVLDEVHRILKPGGFLIIETLNIGSLNARFMRHRWPLYSPPYHLYYYCARTLEALLRFRGFQTIKILPIHTYMRTFKGYRKIVLNKNSVFRRAIGKLFNDVVLCIAVKV